MCALVTGVQTCALPILLMPVVASVLGTSGEKAITFGDVVVKILTTLIQLGLFVGVMLVVGRRIIPWLLEHTAGTGSRELFTLAVLSIALGIAVGSAELFGVSFALGAFFAGMLLNESELSHKAAQDSLPMRDAFAVLFFVSVGMLFDPHILVEQPLLVLATAFIIVFGKSAAAYLIVRAFGHPRSTALTISASLAQIGEFAFLLAGLGVTLELMPSEAQDLVLAGALISIMLNPLIFRLLDRWQARQDAGEQARRSLDADAALAEDAATHQVPDEVTDHAIVVGYGRVDRKSTRLNSSH